MRWSAEKLRWVLLSGALLLAGVVAALFGLANYRAGKIWQRILARNGVNLRQETDGYTYSQSDGKRTAFTLHAAKAIPHGNGNFTLHDAVLVLYAKDGRTDRIYGNQFEYDQSQGVARAIGEVHMDLEAPQTPGPHAHRTPAPDLSFTPDDDSTADPSLIHVRTSGLVYTRKLGVAATDQPAEFRYEGLTCTSRGAEFDSGQDILRLLAEVHLTGMLRKAPFTLTATKAELDRGANTADLVHPHLVSNGRDGRAAHALLHLRKDGSLQTGDADGDVELRSGTKTVSAPQLHGDFAEQSRPQHALLSGGVHFVDSNTLRPAQGQAERVDLAISPTGVLHEAVATGGVTLLVKETAASGGPPLARQLRAQQATASFEPDAANLKRSVLRRLHMVGAAEFAGQASAKTPGESPALTQVNADDLTTTFVPGRGRSLEPQHMTGFGHTELQQTADDGAHQRSTGDALELSFGPPAGAGPNAADGGVQVSSAVQTGHVDLRSWAAPKPDTAMNAQEPSIGHAQKADFEASAGTLTLTGGGSGRAEIVDGQTQVVAPSIVLHQGTGDGEASGGVAATTDGSDGSPATHILADHAALLHEANLSRFFGTDAQPARLWQSGSQVQAATIVLDGRQHTLSARPQGKGGAVNAVFTSAEGPVSAGRSAAPATHGPAERTESPEQRRAPNRKGLTAGAQPFHSDVPEASRDTMQIRAAAMDYSDPQHEATFRGGVVMRGPEGTIAGDRGAAFLQPPATKPAATTGVAEQHGAPAAPNLGGRLERFAVLGDVRLNQPGRTGAGEQLTYTAVTNSYVLTGTAADVPRVRDAQQGTVTGATLLFGAGDSSIVVAGAPGSGKGASPTRVHTETDLKPQ